MFNNDLLPVHLLSDRTVETTVHKFQETEFHYNN